MRLYLITIFAAVIHAQTGYSPNYAGTGNGCKAGGTCYYIDYESGSDSNNGTSKATPWKSVPGMTCATANASAHVFAQTDQFILKGGVTWPAACFPWSITSGDASTPNGYAYPGMYIGYDPTWHKGTVVSVRVIDPGVCTANAALSVALSGGGGAGATATASLEPDPTAAGDLQYVTVTNAGTGYTSNPTVSFSVTAGSCATLPTAHADIYSPIMDGAGIVYGNSTTIPQMFWFGVNRGTVDHLEFKNYLWYAGLTYSGGSPQVIYSDGTYIEWRNIYLHNCGADGPANRNAVTGQRGNSATAGIAGCGAFNDPSCQTGTVLTNSVLNNFEAEARGCDNAGLINPSPVSCVQNTAIYVIPTVTNNVINSWRAGLYTAANLTSGHVIAGNKVWAILCDIGTDHPDAFYVMGGSIIYNNVLRDIYSGTAAFYVDATDGSAPVAKGMTTYIFNNVVWRIGTSTPPIGWASSFSSASATSFNPAPDLRAYNNTLYSYNGNTNCINAGKWFGASPTLNASYSFTLKNTHCISDQSLQHWYESQDSVNGYGIWNGLANPNTAPTRAAIDPTAVIQSPATATGQGYVAANNFAPTDAADATVTFTGDNLTALCSTSVGGVSLAPLCADIRGVARPTVGAWQAGAYQYVPPPSGTNRRGSNRGGARR